MNPKKILPNVWTYLGVLLIIVLLLGHILQRRTGLADNGDYFLRMGWFATMPVGFEERFPEPGSELYKERYAYYWWPEWKLEFHAWPSIRSSSV